MVWKMFTSYELQYVNLLGHEYSDNFFKMVGRTRCSTALNTKDF